MVCKNCGAELKPGVMYCLECGSYVEDGAESPTNSAPVESKKGGPQKKVVKKTKYKVKMSTKDWLIYGGLFLVLIGSIVVIIITLINGSKKEEIIQPLPQQQTPEVVKQDQTYTIDNYTLVVDKEYNSDVQNDMLYVSDDTNFTLNFQVTSDDFEAYIKDRKKLEDELKKNHYEVISSSEKTYGSRKFIICNIKVNGTAKYLYISKINDKYSAMGIIEELTVGKWEDALPALDKVINTVQITDDDKDEKDNKTSDSDKDDSKTTNS